MQVDIFEADPEVRTVGAGITVWPRTWTVMRHLGLYEQLSEVTVQRAGVVPNEDTTELSEYSVALWIERWS